MSQFNPDQFLDQTITESNDTTVVPVPAGDYTAVATDIKCRPWQSKNDPSMAGLALDITWEIDDEAVKQLLGRTKVTVKGGVMLDTTDSGGLDMSKGRNIALGRLREALDLNQPGKPFSFSMIPGRVAKINVSHRVVGEEIFAEVKRVAHV